MLHRGKHYVYASSIHTYILDDMYYCNNNSNNEFVEDRLVINNAMLYVRTYVHIRTYITYIVVTDFLSHMYTGMQ